MAVYVDGVSEMNARKIVTLDIYQDDTRRQTVRIQFTGPPHVHVTVDGVGERAMPP